MKTEIKIYEKIPGLNGSDGLIREHFHLAKKRKTRYAYTMISQTRNRHKGPVKITYTRYGIKLMDWDNMCASFKHLGDALVLSGIITDDNASLVKKFYPHQVKIRHRKDQKVVIEIEDLPMDQKIQQSKLEL